MAMNGLHNANRLHVIPMHLILFELIRFLFFGWLSRLSAIVIPFNSCVYDFTFLSYLRFVLCQPPLSNPANFYVVLFFSLYIQILMFPLLYPVRLYWFRRTVYKQFSMSSSALRLLLTTPDDEVRYLWGLDGLRVRMDVVKSSPLCDGFHPTTPTQWKPARWLLIYPGSYSSIINAIIYLYPCLVDSPYMLQPLQLFDSYQQFHFRLYVQIFSSLVSVFRLFLSPIFVAVLCNVKYGKENVL